MKKKILYGLSFLSLCLIVTGCGSDNNSTANNTDNNEDNGETAVEREENHKNKVVCSYVDSDGKYVLYFDKNDNITSFDAYDTIDISVTNHTDEEIRDFKKDVCNGKGEFKKEWIKECDMKVDGSKYTLHVYIDNGEWFGDMSKKDEILDYAKENGIDGAEVICK